MKTVKINLYSFDELMEESKNRAINDAIIFLNNDLIDFEDESGNMQEEYFEHTEEEAEEFIRINDYLFFKNGELANVTEYTGAHPRAGQTELILNGEAFNI